MISFSRTWRRLSHQFLHRRRQSIDSTCSSTSNKSVRFYAIDAIYYTHSSAEYDRTPLCETDDRLAFMSEHLILYADDLDEDEDEEEEEDDEDDHDSFYDEQLILNTNHNRLSSIATSTAHTTVAAMR
ncbi:uncharacterized protein BYT42DRAFT_87149 [Radiomyces spectabilis]|uniref:uncharacterized protein n=1 Tax=Radiomyces spectabilis TaxID=64574 RepID=UPI002220E394|nr:uncharacterized protein BYT42DRAFT_87149 [Radiomyces spectabilis]KAI8370400.1 hypothetical protein BYT42DRAFT_87149 [Radiomyces spectabilis]